MIANIEIANFRCFRRFKLNEFGRVTLISGRNNVGKTALLEALFLLFASGNPDALIRVNLIRGNILTFFYPDITWEHLFYNKDIDSAIKISTEIDGKNISLELYRNSTIKINHAPAVPHINLQFQQLPNSYPLTIKYKMAGCENNGICIPVQNGLTINWDTPPVRNELPIIKYIGVSQGNEQNLAIQFGQVVKYGQKALLIEALRELEPDIVDISTVAEDTPRLYAQKKNGPMLPLSSMGNGICRLAQILCAICEQRKSIVLVDEIDSGFHYSFFNKLWQIVSTIAKKNDVHVVATTHSYDCLKGASACFDNPDDDFTYIRLGKDGAGRILPHIYSSNLMAYAIESEMELR